MDRQIDQGTEQKPRNKNRPGRKLVFERGGLQISRKTLLPIPLLLLREPVIHMEKENISLSDHLIP